MAPKDDSVRGMRRTGATTVPWRRTLFRGATTSGAAAFAWALVGGLVGACTNHTTIIQVIDGDGGVTADPGPRDGAPFDAADLSDGATDAAPLDANTIDGGGAPDASDAGPLDAGGTFFGRPITATARCRASSVERVGLGGPNYFAYATLTKICRGKFVLSGTNPAYPSAHLSTSGGGGCDPVVVTDTMVSDPGGTGRTASYASAQSFMDRGTALTAIWAYDGRGYFRSTKIGPGLIGPAANDPAYLYEAPTRLFPVFVPGDPATELTSSPMYVVESIQSPVMRTVQLSACTLEYVFDP